VCGQFERFFANELPAFKLPIGQFQYQPLDHIPRVRTRATGRSLRISIPRKSGRPLVVKQNVQVGAIGARGEVSISHAGLCHAQGFEKLVTGQSGPLLPGGLG